VPIQVEEVSQAHIVEEDEGGLLLAEAVKIKKFPNPDVAAERVPAMMPARWGVVHLVEEHIFKQTWVEEDVVNSSRWVVDTGATNHMIGDRSAFVELDTGVCGMVQFGDGSVVHITGCEIIIFSCKSGKHTGINYIPRLKTSILNVGQLDELSYEVNINCGVMHIKDVERRLLTLIPWA
jgi:hypothetical protein